MGLHVQPFSTLPVTPVVTYKCVYTSYLILSSRQAANMSTDRNGMQYLRGSLYGLAAVSIWSGWIVVARLGLRTSLTPWDIAAPRLGAARVSRVPPRGRGGG